VVVSWSQRLLFHSQETRRARDGRNIMLEGLFQPMHLLIIAGLALLILGPKKLPELGKGLGESIRGFKSALQEKDEPPVAKTTLPKNAEEKV
jgi:sec-independent protein translocase protein TatA